MRKLITIFFLILFTNFLFAQKDIVNYFRVPELYKPMMVKYMEPMAKMTNGNLNAGWYHSANPHRFLGFDLSLSMSVSNVPSTQRGFYMTSIPEFEQYYTVNSESSLVAPNVAGTTEDLLIIKSIADGRQVTVPDGSDLQKVSLPFISLGVGLPYHTEIRLRYMPKMDYSNLGKLSQYGISIKHSIKEYLPGLNDIPAFSLSVMGGVSMQKNDIALDYPSANVNTQILEGRALGYTGRLLFGLDVRVFSAYAGVGYGSSSIEYAFRGDYFIGDVNGAIEESNPVTLTYDYSQMDVDLGVNAKIGFVDLFAEYSPGEYSTFTFGIGYCLR